MFKVYLKLALKFVLLAIGVMLLVLQIQHLNQGRAKIKDVLARYEPISATIVGSKIQSEYRYRRHHRIKYRPVVEYRYAVDGRVRYGDRYAAHDVYRHRRDEVQEILWAYPDGLRVTVLYDPQKPENSVLVLPVLESFSDDQIVYIVLLSVFVLSTGCWVLWSLWGLKHAYSSGESAGKNTV